MFKIYDGREKFYQWDLDRKLIVEDASVTEVHFCNRTDSCSLVCETYTENGLTVVNVPNILLQTDWKIHVYAYDGKHTKHDECYEVVSRSKPADYVYTETEVKTWDDLNQRIEEIEKNGVSGGGAEEVYIGNVEPTDEDIKIWINPDEETTEGGISVTHQWNGTVLTIVSASGTSSADLKGEPGKDGAPGKDGKDGAPGKDGKDGVNGKDGKDGIDGVNGKDGADGKDGANGKDGVIPSFANSLEELQTSGDTSKVYVLPDGYLYAYVEAGSNVGYYENQYKNITTNSRLSSGGGISGANGMEVTDFIAISDANGERYDYVRLSNIPFNKNSTNYNNHRVAPYDENKNFITGIGMTIQGSMAQHGTTVTYDDATGYLTQFTVPTEEAIPALKYIRICYDIPNNASIASITVENETTEGWVNTGLQFVATGYEDRIEKLEDDVSALKTGNSIPGYVLTEAAEVARTVNNHQNDSSIVFAFLADAHCEAANTQDAVEHAAQALRAIDNRCPMDFVVHGGDLSPGGGTTTRETTFDDVEKYTEIMAQYNAHIPAIWCIGNHDDAPYRATADRLTQTESYTLFGRKNLRADAVCDYGCNYGYVDFDNRKLRVIYLDTHDKRDWGSVDCTNSTPDFLSVDNISKAQIDWLANTALDFSDKDNANEWAIVVVSHAALDKNHSYTDPSVSNTWYAYNTINATNILRAYEDGVSVTVSNISGLKNSYSDTYDFSTLTQRAKVYCLVHGHNHSYIQKEINGFKSIGCPNVMDGRERASDDGVTYSKVAGTAEGTSFCIITVDRNNDVIYADHYGAGYDRVIE
jgi:hypothetical protein